MRLYNTLSKKVEEFKPKIEGKVNLYTCGPTVYNFSHVGNLRTYIFEDVLQKSLEYLGYDVKRVMNITDVGHMTSDADFGEDKMLKGAKREGKTVYEIADFYTKAFLNDMSKLNIAIPSIIEKASANVDIYIKIIERLLEKGYAYISNGNVYFDVSKAKDYYALSGKNPDDLLVAVRETVEDDKAKKSPFDFGLWFTISKFENQAMKWDSPWGVGYPGWHIECSGIAIKEFGDFVDIHCGGVDNIFPHHTNEIAQSEGYLGHEWCNFWCHGAHLNDKTGKMSKSNGEFLTLSLLESKGYRPLDYRYFCLSSHYRNTLVFTYESLDIAKNALTKLKKRVQNLEDNGIVNESQFNDYNNKFKEALSNDLNTAQMLTSVYDVLKDSELDDSTKLSLIRSFDCVLSLNLDSVEDFGIDEEFKKYIEEKIKIRDVAKKNKDFALADSIRDELLEKKVKLLDKKEGTTYTIVD